MTQDKAHTVAGEPLEGDVRPPVPPSTPWIGDVIPALAWALDSDIPWGNQEAARRYHLEPAEKVVVILADGLGTHLLRDHLGYAKTLRSAKGEPTTAQTCAPSTTAAAITSFATGRLPAETNMVGYSVQFEGKFMNLLNFRAGVIPEKWQPTPTHFERLGEAGVESHLFTAPKFNGSGLTRAALRGSKFHGTAKLEDRFNWALDLLAAGASFAFVYWADLDKVGHQAGPLSEAWAQALETFDYELGKFLAKVPSNVTVLLTADHGMVEVDERIDIAHVNALNEDVEVIAGEGRAVHVHARKEKAKDVAERWRDYFANDAWIFTPDQMHAVVGEGPGVSLLGDLLVMPKNSFVVVDSRTQPAAAIAMKGVHGSLTPQEMQVPVWRLA